MLDSTPSLKRAEKKSSSWILQPFLFTMCTSGVMYSPPPSPGSHLETKAGSLAKHRASGHEELFLG